MRSTSASPDGPWSGAQLRACDPALVHAVIAPSRGCTLGVAMVAKHVLLCYLRSAQSDDALRQVADLCARTGAELSVVMPVIDAAIPDGCCGIQGEQWRRAPTTTPETPCAASSICWIRRTWLKMIYEY